MNKVLTSLLLLCLVAPSVYCDNSDSINMAQLQSYNKWRLAHKRVYLNEDEQIYRQQVFFENLKRVEAHSQNTDATYTIGLNQFSDMSKEEYSQRILNKKLSQQHKNRNLESMDFFEAPKSNFRGLQGVPIAVDWRKKGAVTPVKDQGQCGSCWTFSVAGTLESFNFIKNRVLTTYSEQQLLDCANEQTTGFYGWGCDGGNQEEGIKYTMKFGLVQGQQYRYMAAQGNCRVTSPTNGFYPKRYQKVQTTVEGLRAAINFAPVSASVDASNWWDYRGGVFNGCGKHQQAEDLNHAVIAVGYDAQGSWIIKNSYGTSWGEQGYMRLAAGNECGILMDNVVVTA